jgi:hypothetical protein
MIDILYLTHNRREFTEASLKALLENTNWGDVSRLVIYDDASVDGTPEYLRDQRYPVKMEFRGNQMGSPVAVMNHYLCSIDPHENRIFAKVDNDTMVPKGWFEDCLSVMARQPELDILGIEAFNRVAPGRIVRGYRPVEHIGGIGLMRSGAFVTLPRPCGRFGFTAWQQKATWAKKGWIDPSLPVFLLDRLPREPWRSLVAEYIAKGWQRDWGPYNEKDKALWSWWCE